MFKDMMRKYYYMIMDENIVVKKIKNKNKQIFYGTKHSQLHIKMCEIIIINKIHKNIGNPTNKELLIILKKLDKKYSK